MFIPVSWDFPVVGEGFKKYELTISKQERHTVIAP